MASLMCVVALATFPLEAAEPKFAKAFEEQIHARLSSYRVITIELPDGKLSLHISEANNRILFAPLLVYCDSKQRVTRIISAKEAELKVDLRAEEMFLHVKAANFVDTDSTVRIWVAYKVLSLPLPRISFDPNEGRSETDIQLEAAFGKGCKELEYPIKLHIPLRQMLIAATEVKCEPDGRYKFTSCSLAWFEKEKVVAVNALRSQHAWIAFDQPSGSIWRDVARKIVSVELSGGMRLVFDK